MIWRKDRVISPPGLKSAGPDRNGYKMKTLFLDLDGTLTDARPGILRSIFHALEKMGHPAPDPAAMDWAIGPPLVETFARLGVSDVDRALALYRARYTDTGLFENEVYEGVIETLTSLQAAGHALCVATAKPHAYATRITAHFGLARFMEHEFGPELDGTRNDKAELLAHALALTGKEPRDCLMIGDRRHDHDAARAVGMRSVAARWGYGTAREHALADAVCDRPADLPAVIARLL